MKKIKKLGLKIVMIKKIDAENYRIKLCFNDGFVGEVSLVKFFDSPKGLAAEILRGSMFNKCFIESGALAWPNGLEFCPDAIRLWIEEKTKSLAA